MLQKRRRRRIAETPAIENFAVNIIDVIIYFGFKKNHKPQCAKNEKIVY